MNLHQFTPNVYNSHFQESSQSKTRDVVRAVQHSHEFGIKDTVGTPYVNSYILLRRNVYE